MNRLLWGVVGFSVLSVVQLCHRSTASAQTATFPSAQATNDRDGKERKVRVILPSPYEQTDARLKAAKAIKPAAPAASLVTEPEVPAAGAPDAQASKALTFGQAARASTLSNPAIPRARASKEPFKNVAGPSKVWERGKHDLNGASLADLNRLEGGGLIGRAIIAGRPYRSSDELVTRRILSRAAYERIKAQVTVQSLLGNP